MGVEGKQQNVCKHMDLILQGISFSLSRSSFFFLPFAIYFILFSFSFGNFCIQSPELGISYLFNTWLSNT